MVPKARRCWWVSPPRSLLLTAGSPCTCLAPRNFTPTPASQGPRMRERKCFLCLCTCPCPLLLFSLSLFLSLPLPHSFPLPVLPPCTQLSQGSCPGHLRSEGEGQGYSSRRLSMSSLVTTEHSANRQGKVGCYLPRRGAAVLGQKQ